MEPVINLLSGSVFETENGTFIKLMNPEIPRLAKVSDYPVWAADIGNGHIEKFDPHEHVTLKGRCYDLVTDNQSIQRTESR